MATLTCSLSHCQSLLRINDILNNYNNWLKERKNGMYDIINTESYSNIDLLNDFNHLLFVHHSDDEFEKIYDLLTKKNQCINCVSLRRNYRNKTNDILRKSMYFGYDNSKEINCQQILDKIHCYFYHSYQFGYKLNKLNTKQLSQISQTEMKEMKEMKNDDIINNAGIDIQFESLCNFLKKTIKNDNCTKDTINFIKKNKEKYTTKTDIAATPICGYKYNYWNNQDLDISLKKTNKNKKLINFKYSSLKEEMIENKISSLSPMQWNDLIEKATNYQKTNYVKTIKCQIKYGFGVKYSTMISIPHLIAIQIWCNFIHISTSFKDTYNLFFEEQHSCFANFGKLLTETVQVFGTSIYENNNNNNNKSLFYHCIEQTQLELDKLVFIEQTQFEFNLPLSTTSELQMITMLNMIDIKTEKGLIIELHGNYGINKYNTFFDCRWISDFINEDELLFIGGNKALQISKIFDIKLKLNYIFYAKALNIIENIIIKGSDHYNNDNDGNDKKIENIVQEILSYPKTFNNTYFATKNRLKIDFKAIKNKQFLSNLLMNDNETMIDLDKLIKLFPNINSIRLIHATLSIKLFESILNYIQSLELETKIRRITIYKSIKTTISAEKLTLKYRYIFKKLNWKCYYLNTEHKIIIAKDEDDLLYHKFHNNSINSFNFFNCFTCTKPKNEDKKTKMTMTNMIYSYYSTSTTKAKPY